MYARSAWLWKSSLLQSKVSHTTDSASESYLAARILAISDLSTEPSTRFNHCSEDSPSAGLLTALELGVTITAEAVSVFSRGLVEGPEEAEITSSSEPAAAADGVVDPLERGGRGKRGAPVPVDIGPEPNRPMAILCSTVDPRRVGVAWTDKPGDGGPPRSYDDELDEMVDARIRFNLRGFLVLAAVSPAEGGRWASARMEFIEAAMEVRRERSGLVRRKSCLSKS